eukprot:tig00001003_g6272.t1
MGVYSGLRARELGGRPPRALDPQLAFESGSHDEVTLDAPPFCCAWSSPANEASAHMRLAASGEDGRITIVNPFRRARGSGLERTQWIGHVNAVFDVAWCHGGSSVASASADQTCRIWSAETQQSTALLAGHKGTVKVIRPSPFNPHVFLTGCRDGSACLWDVRASCTASRGGEPALRPVRALHNIHARPAAPALSRARSGIVLEREQKRARLSSSPAPASGSRREPRAARRGPPAQDAQQSVTAAEFLDEEHIATGGAADGEVKIFDLRSTAGKTPPPAQRLAPALASGSGGAGRSYGVTSLSVDGAGALLSVSATNSRVYVYSTAALGEPLRECAGHEARNFYIKAALSPDGRHVLSGSSDGAAYLWKARPPRPPRPPKPTRGAAGGGRGGGGGPAAYERHAGEVSAVAWGAPLLFATAGGDDYRLRVWHAAAA